MPGSPRMAGIALCSVGVGVPGRRRMPNWLPDGLRSGSDESRPLWPFGGPLCSRPLCLPPSQPHHPWCSGLSCQLPLIDGIPVACLGNIPRHRVGQSVLAGKISTAPGWFWRAVPRLTGLPHRARADQVAGDSSSLFSNLDVLGPTPLASVLSLECGDDICPNYPAMWDRAGTSRGEGKAPGKGATWPP